MRQVGPGQTVRSWMCLCGNVMFFADAHIEQLRRCGGVVCGRCSGQLTLCSPLERDRPGQNFYRKYYDRPLDFTEIEWLEMGERQKAYDARMRLPEQVYVGGGWMAPCSGAT